MNYFNNFLFFRRFCCVRAVFIRLVTRRYYTSCLWYSRGLFSCCFSLPMTKEKRKKKKVNEKLREDTPFLPPLFICFETENNCNSNDSCGYLIHPYAILPLLGFLFVCLSELYYLQKSCGGSHDTCVSCFDIASRQTQNQGNSVQKA